MRGDRSLPHTTGVRKSSCRHKFMVWTPIDLQKTWLPFPPENAENLNGLLPRTLDPPIQPLERVKRRLVFYA